MSDFTAELTAVTASVIDRIGVDHQTPARAVDTAIWEQLHEGGFATVGAPEEVGGGGAALSDALAVVSTAAGKGALTPLIEHGILALWLAADAGYALESTSATIAIGDAACLLTRNGEQTALDGTVTDVAFAADCDTVLIVLPAEHGSSGARLASIRTDAPGVHVSAETDLVGVSLATITFDGAPVLFDGPTAITADDVIERGALAYAIAAAAVAASVRDHTLLYATERSQFGRPLTQFQAVQQRLASMAALTTLMDISAREAASAYESADRRTALTAVAAAKVVTSRSAHPVAASGHQIHGAIGFTSEHALGRYSTSLWSWRDRHGTEQYWAGVLAGQVLDDGIDIWDLVTGVPGTTTAEQA
ncbi:acyl-CoA dehydrogenase (plasmid) [Rhodococcus erythropolis R138]|uniref:acyl-CoA dehydrogenase family protein n=1 Tax=Rhodococcus erythropolis TaxID=1833 RepID=UPI0004A87480|nr:acyl-CoA dehydrogenase family protein [Rhodococcus erythropolis]ALU73527.1 acyl-CoA dehydrogenase [Rhodococcus erythropolis R138]